MKSIAELQSLRGRAAFVTGGAGNIGRAICDTLAELGASVAVLDSAAEACTATATQLREKFSTTAIALPVNLEDEAAVRRAPGEAAAQLGSLVAKVAGVDEGPRLVDHLAVNIGSGRGHSAFDVVEALRGSVGDPFAVDIVGRRAGDPAYVVAAPELAAGLLGWRARLGLRDITDSAWAAWQHAHS